MVMFMANYDQFAPYYDQLMGNRHATWKHIRKLLNGHLGSGKAVLELGCGTGSVLKSFPRNMHLVGLEASMGMLAIAKKKVPHAALYCQDMSNFRLPRKFDIIICVFDTINHLTSFKSWVSLFRGVSKHLNPGGAFLFDINTLGKLQRHATEPIWVTSVGKDIFMINVTQEKKSLFRWDVDVFERQKKDLYRRHSEKIYETSFPDQQIRKALRQFFLNVAVCDPDNNRPGATSERLYYVVTN